MLWRHTLTMSTAGNDPVSSLRVNEFICKSSDTVALILRFGRAHQRSSLSLRSSQANIPRVISWSTIYSDVSRLTMGHLTQRISNYRNVKGNWGTNGVFPSLDNHCLNFFFFFCSWLSFFFFFFFLTSSDCVIWLCLKLPVDVSDGWTDIVGCYYWFNDCTCIFSCPFSVSVQRITVQRLAQFLTGFALYKFSLSLFPAS